MATRKKIKITDGDIRKAKEDVIIIPCGTMSTYIGDGVDYAIFSEYPDVLAEWREAIGNDCFKTFGDTYCIQKNNKSFVFIIVPPYENTGNISLYSSLEECYGRALTEAINYGRSIATPLLGTGKLRWPLSEAFFALNTVIDNLDMPYIKPEFNLYIYDDKVRDYLKKNKWDITQCIEEKTITNAITDLCDKGYERWENNSLLEYYYGLYKRNTINGLYTSEEAQAEALITGEWDISKFLDKKLDCLLNKDGKRMTNTELRERCQFSKNDISDILYRNGDFSFSKDNIIALMIGLEADLSEAKSALNTFGFGFSSTKRDQFIKDVFTNHSFNNVKDLNKELESRGFYKLKEQAPLQHTQFAKELNSQIEYISEISGEKLTNVNISEKTGFTKNELSIIRNGRKLFSPTKDKVIALAIATKASTKQLEKWLSYFDFALEDCDRDNEIKKLFDKRILISVNDMNKILRERDYKIIIARKHVDKEKENQMDNEKCSR